MTKSVPEAEFEANCHTLIDEVVTNGDEVLVTKDGKPVAKLVPFESASGLRTLEQLRGSVTILGDIVAPLDEPWDAER
jgi:prevent-host-death family protein